MLDIYFGSVNETSIETCLTFLSKSEIRRYKQLKIQSKAHEFAFTRAHLRLLLAQIIGKEASDISLMSDAHGKPFWSDNEDITFNVSHSQGHCLIVIDPKQQTRLGIDIELHRETDILGLSKRYFSEREQQVLIDCDDEALQKQYFFNIWSRKEAVVKAHGKGIGLGLQGFTVSADEHARIIESHERLSFMESWQLFNLQDLLQRNDISACLCTDRPATYQVQSLAGLIA